MIVLVEQTQEPLPSVCDMFVDTKKISDVTDIINHTFGYVSYRVTYPLSRLDKLLAMEHGVWDAYSFEKYHPENIDDIT